MMMMMTFSDSSETLQLSEFTRTTQQRLQLKAFFRVPRTVKHIIGLVKNINGRVVNRTKNVLEAGLDGARKVVGAAFGLVSKENSV